VTCSLGGPAGGDCGHNPYWGIGTKMVFLHRWIGWFMLAFAIAQPLLWFAFLRKKAAGPDAHKLNNLHAVFGWVLVGFAGWNGFAGSNTYQMSWGEGAWHQFAFLAAWLVTFVPAIAFIWWANWIRKDARIAAALRAEEAAGRADMLENEKQQKLAEKAALDIIKGGDLVEKKATPPQLGEGEHKEANDSAIPSVHGADV